MEFLDVVVWAGFLVLIRTLLALDRGYLREQHLSLDDVFAIAMGAAERRA